MINDNDNKPKKMTYKCCFPLVEDTDHQIALFNDQLFDKSYQITLEKSGETIVVRMNDDEVIFISPNEFGLVIINDPKNEDITFKINLANLFVYSGYHFSYNAIDKITLNRDDGYQWKVNTYAIISPPSFNNKEKVYIE